MGTEKEVRDKVREGLDKPGRFVFAGTEVDRKLSDVMTFPTMDELYKKSLRNRDTLRETFEKSVNAAFENLLTLERLAHANGFSFVMLKGPGGVYPEWGEECDIVTFVQSWAVHVKDDEKEGRQ